MPEKPIRITKVKVTVDKKVHIEYEQRNARGSWDEFALTCEEEALPSFYMAMASLSVHVVEICEMDSSFTVDRVKVRGVSFAYSGEKEVMGATISAGIELRKSYGQVNINTPFKASGSYGDGDPDPKAVLPDVCVEKLTTLQIEAIQYINGERAQQKLDLEPDKRSNLQIVMDLQQECDGEK
jgi:hypothetical protein